MTTRKMHPFLLFENVIVMVGLGRNGSTLTLMRKISKIFMAVLFGIKNKS